MIFKCKECGEEVDTSRTSLGDILLKAHLCFTCEHFLNAPEEDRVIIDGGMYHIGNENETGMIKWRGFGGRKFTIKMNTGETIVSTNMNYNGVIPEHLRDRLPDTAEFV